MLMKTTSPCTRNSELGTRHRSLPSASLIALLLLCGLIASVRAADKTWDGEGVNDSWLTGANWDPMGGGGTAPAANDSLFFDGSTRLTPNNNFSAGTIFNNITFNGGASSFTLGGNSLTITNPPAADYTAGLNAPYLGGSISNASPNAQTINLPLTLANGHHYLIGNAGGGTLNLSGAITLGSAASATFSTGVNLNGSGLVNVNGILGAWATMNPPTDWAALDGGGNVISYTGYTDIIAGSAIVSAPSSNVRITDSGPYVTLASSTLTDINTLHFGSGATANQTNDLASSRILRFGAKGGIINSSRTATGTSRSLTIGTNLLAGAVTAGGADNTPGDLYLIETPFIGNTGNQIVMNARITNNGTGAVTVHTLGHISFPNVAHTYSGGTYIHGGRISATGPNTLGTGLVYVYPGGQLFLNASGTYTNTMFIAGYGNAESVGNGAIRMGGRSISGNITLVQDAATANGTISGIITGPGGLIVGAGSGNGVGTLTVGSSSGANDYAGDTTINGTNATAASTLTIASGRNNIMPHGAGKGNVILNGATVVATFNLNNTSQTINGLSSTGAVANAIVTSGAAGAVTLTVGDGNATSSFGGTLQNGSGTVSLTKIGTGTQSLTGVSTYTGNTAVGAGALVFGAGSFPAGTPTVTINSNATLNVTAVSPLTLATVSTLSTSNGTVAVGLQSSVNSITTSNLTALGATNFINVGSIGTIASYPAQLTAIKYTTLNGTLNFGLGTLPPSPGVPYVAFVSNNVANSSVDVVITAGPPTLRWTGYDGVSLNSTWDIATTTDWKTLPGVVTTYTDGSFALFDNSASNGVVTLAQDVAPAGITISNTALAYTINGGFKIGGAGALIKQGAGTATLDNSGANDFSGSVTISAGTLQIGNSDTGGSLPASSSILDNGALVFNRSDALTVPNVISGTGTVTQNGSGTLVLSAANTFTGAATIASGTTLQTGNSGALGATNGGTTVTSGGTLDFGANAINLGQEIVTASGGGVGGAGAILNSSGSTTFVGPNIARVVLAGDTVFGGSGRWDLRASTTANPTLASLSTGGVARKLTKTGANEVIIAGVTVDPQLGNVEVQQGILTLQDATTGLGNSANSLTVFPGATLRLFALTNQLNKVITLGGDGANASVNASSGASTIIGPMAVTNDCILNIGTAAVSLNLNNVITGPGKLTKIGSGLLTLSGNSPAYAGGLVLSAGSITLASSGTLNNSLGVLVSAGKFTLNGSLLGAGLTNNATTILAGKGSSAGPVDVSGELDPGDTGGVMGTFTAGGLTLESGATLNFDLTSTNAIGGGTNDLIVVNGDLTVNGNAITINPSGLLQTGVSHPYRIFNYTGNLIWNADLSVSGPNGYTFTVDTNTHGQINLVASGGPPVWNGGSLSDSLWTSSANWGGVTIASGNTLYFAGINRLNNTNNTGAGTAYTDIGFNFDAGAFVLNGDPIALGGNILNLSPNTETIKLGLSLGANSTFNGGSGNLIIGGGVTNTASLTTTLSGTGIITNLFGTATGAETNTILLNLTNAAWTVANNASSTSITNPVTLDIQAGTFNFGVGSSAPVLDCNGTVNARLGVIGTSNATLNVVNGTLTIAARLNTGTAANSLATINQSGGTLNIQDLLQVSDGSSSAATTLNLTGGFLNVADAGGPRNTFLASRGTGVVNIASSAVMSCATLDMSRNAAGNTAGSVGVVNLNGGLLAVSRIGAATGAAQSGGTPTATLNFNGGTLKANASSTTWIQGNASAPTIPITCIVKSGGAIIDTTNFDDTIVESLQHDSSLGVTPDGGLRKLGSGTLTLSANGTYTGGTAVSNGTLVVNAILSGSAVTVATNGTLMGNGTCGSTLTVQDGGTVSPGTSLGTLTVSNAISLGGTTVMEINAASATTDLLRSINSSVTYGGKLTVTNLGGLLTNGSSFKLFNSGSGSYLSSFATTQLPGLGSGQSWNNQLGTSGTISVVGNPAPPIISSAVPSGGNLIISGGNGVTNGTFQVLTSTTVTAPLSSWSVLGAGQFDGNGNFSVQVAIDPATPQRFFSIRMP